MKHYLRPLGILSGAAARMAVEQSRALPLAGGPLAFALVEVIERRGPGAAARQILPATDLREELALHMAARAPIGSLPARPPIVMGVLNATPDSFSDGGAFLDPGRAVAHGGAMLDAGAGIVDIGGELTRPGAEPVDPADEIARIVPIVAGLRAPAAIAGALLSIDTRNALTMRAALDAGVTMVNDVSALTHDPAAMAIVAAADVPVVLMHMRGDPRTMQNAPAYDDLALDIFDYLEARIADCEAAGIQRRRMIADPGIGFGKTIAHNLTLLGQLGLFHGLGVSLMVGVSRKGFIGRLSHGEPPDRRLPGSLAAGIEALGQGTRILRVHDVPETVQALRILEAVRSGG